MIRTKILPWGKPLTKSSLLHIKIAALLVLMIFALATLDYAAMHLMVDKPEWMYRYWLAQGFSVVTFAFCMACLVYLFKPAKIAVTTFLTTILMFVAGLLDLFYAWFAFLRGEPYSFQVWHWAYKLGWTSWGWLHQAVWALVCGVVIFYIWHLANKR